MTIELGIHDTNRTPHFPLPASPLSTEPDAIIDNLVGALRAAVASPATVALARRTLADVRRIQGAAHLGAITERITREFRLRPDDLQSKSREQRIAFARQLAMFLCRRLTGASFPAIGEHFGGRHHTMVIHAYQLIGRRIQRDAAFRLFIERLQSQITNAVPTTAVAA
jgi:chromosomal replication initiator protein